MSMSTQTPNLRTAAQAVIDRWDTPLWKDAPATAGYIAALRDALAADHTEHHLEMVGRWYMITQDGAATLCVDREDAEAEARKADRKWPRNGPHRAVQLVEAQAAARPALPEIKDMHNGPQQLNLSDRAMWVLGWNECRDAARDAGRAMRAAQPAGAQQPGVAYAVLTYKQVLGSKNCMQCCVSYMLGLPLESVPDFATDGGWELFSDFAESQGYAAVMLPGNREFEADYLASGTTARGTSHMVVMNDGKLVHDPHPSNAGLVDVQCVWLLAKRATPRTVQADEHAEFETAAKAYTSNVNFERDGTGYADMTAELLWHGWKLRASHGQAPAQAAPAAVAGCTRSHPHENMDNACRAKAALAEMRSKAARGAEATAHDLDRFVALLTAKPTTQPSPAAQGDALDAARLDWLTFNLSGKALRDIGVVWSEHGDARRAIDAARAAQEGK